LRLQCLGYSVLKSGQLCLVMKLYAGGTLHDLISSQSGCAVG